MRIQIFWPLVFVVSTQLVHPSCSLLLDSGASLESDNSLSDSDAAQRISRDTLEAPKVPSASLVVPDVSQSGRTHGCRRSTDFFEQVCNNPSGTSGEARRQSQLDPSAPFVSADLLVCDLPEVEPLIRPGSDGQPSEKGLSATYAVSGTIVVREADTDSRIRGQPLPELGDSSSSDTTQSASSFPGPNDEGFWRQRDGRHEWYPAPDPAVDQSRSAPEASNIEARDPNQADSRAEDHQDGSRLSDYNAWSAEQERGAFLSFNEWKERHVQDASDHVKASHTSVSRKGVQDSTIQARSASTASISTPHGAEADSQDSQGHADSNQYRDSASQTSALSDDFAARNQPPPTATAFGQTEARQTGSNGVQHAENTLAGSSGSTIQRKAGVAQVGFSVAAGDTSAQLSKLKHRWNFASLDCAAVVHRTNPEAKFASSILSEKKDRYMLSPCPQGGGGKLKGGSQFVIVELCEEIKIDTLVLANYEFFSNMFKKFTVTAARQLTGRESDWTQLGVFRARNVRGQQVFRIASAPGSEAFFRYVRIDFLEHFGSEFYCPVSLLRVYGITEMEEYKREFETHNGELDALPEVADSGHALVNDAQQLPLDAVDAVATPEPSARDSSHHLDTTNLTAKDEDIWRKHEQAFQRKLENQSRTHDAAELESQDIVLPQRDSSPTILAPRSEEAAQNSISQAQSPGREHADKAQCAMQDDPAAKEKDARCHLPRDQLKPFFHLASGSHHPDRARQNPPASTSASTAKADTPANTGSISSRPATGAAEMDADMDRARRASLQRPSGTPPIQQGNPGSESVYRAIHRRLNALESNATLSHSYIEHSGQMLREVFARMEKRQEHRMSDMLRALNASNWHQIESLKRRQHVDLQRAIFEFDVHRQQADTERRALLREVHILAEEVLLEKRLSIAQLILLLVVFVFVGLTRGSRTVPLLHSGFAKIGRSTKRRDAKTESKVVLPASPRRDVAGLEQNMDAKPALGSPLKESMPSQVRRDSRHNSGAGVESAAQRPRYSSEVATPASKLRPVRDTAASPKVSVHMHPRSSVKTPVASLGGRAGSRSESLIGMLSHPRTRGRLVMLLETLDALDRAGDRRRLSKSSTPRSIGIRPRHAGEPDVSTAPTLRTGRAAPGSLPSEIVRRTSRSHRPITPYKQEQAQANGWRQATPGRDRKSAPSGLDDLAGMSSDWTERSENGEVSENAAYLSEEEEGGIRTTGSDLFSLEAAIGPRSNLQLAHPAVTKADLSRSTQTQVPIPAGTHTGSAELPRPALPDDRPAGTPQLGSNSAAVPSDLPSISRADGRLSSSDSESEGGAWHRVLPRRIGNGSSIRRARQGTIDGKSHKVDAIAKPVTRAEAPDRRGSPRPSSAPGSGFKSQRPGLSRLFRANTPDYTGPESPQSRRSGTPDTIRDAKPA